MQGTNEANTSGYDTSGTFFEGKTMSLYELRTIYNAYKDINLKYYLDIWKNYCLYTGDRAKYLKKWQKNLKSGMTLFFTESMYGALLDSDVRYIVGGRGFEDQETANYVLDWLEWLHTRADSDTAFRDCVKETVLLGTGYFKVGYKYREDDFEFMTKDGKTKTGKDIEDFATLDFVPATSMIVDQTARNEDDARYWIVRRVMPIDMVEKVYSFYGIKVDDKIVDNAYYIDRYDYERRKKDLFMNAGTFDFKPIRDEVYYFVKEKNVEVFEVYERGATTIFINGKKFGPYKQIGPRKKPPYRAIQFIRVPNSIQGMGVGVIVKPMQEVFDSVLNSRMDNVALVNNKVFIHVTSLDPILQNTDYLELEPGLIIHTANKDAITELETSDIKQGPIIESNNLMELTQQTLGTTGYQIGSQEKVERSAFGVEALQKAALNRIKGCIKSISKAMGFAAKYQFILSLEYTDKKTFEKVIGPEGYEKLSKITVADAINDIDFEWSMDAMKIQSLSNKMNQAIQLLQVAPKVVDAAGNLQMDVKPLVKFLLQGMGLGDEGILKEEDIQEAIDKAVKTKQMYEQAAGGGAPAPSEEGVPTEETPAESPAGGTPPEAVQGGGNSGANGGLSDMLLQGGGSPTGEM